MAATEPNNNSSITETLSVTLTLRMIMQGKEVGSIIGKKGDNIKKFREESGAKINISDGSCPERIVTVTGTTDTIFKAYDMICKKLEEDLHNTPTVPKPPVTLRLVVPATQCGSLIGKAGSKIKEIREVTGASVQVASEMLPNSTERAVTISGAAQAVTQCIYHICCVMLESPPKGATIPYRPKPAVAPIIYAGGQAYTVQGHMAMPQPAEMANYLQLGKINTFGGGQALTSHHPFLIPAQGAIMPSLMGIPRPQAPANIQQQHEMTIPNDLIGCIIGRGGAKINEIRQMSGAQIKIANSEEGSTDRKVTITGTPETIHMAQYLINTSMELHKNLNPDPTVSATMTPTSLTNQPHPMAVPLTTMMKPFPMLGPQTNTGLLDASILHKQLQAQIAAAQAATKAKVPLMLPNGARKMPDRTKFAPY